MIKVFEYADDSNRNLGYFIESAWSYFQNLKENIEAEKWESFLEEIIKKLHPRAGG